jgi:hypothetical protein
LKVAEEEEVADIQAVAVEVADIPVAAVEVAKATNPVHPMAHQPTTINNNANPNPVHLDPQVHPALLDSPEAMANLAVPAHQPKLAQTAAAVSVARLALEAHLDHPEALDHPVNLFGKNFG